MDQKLDSIFACSPEEQGGQNNVKRSQIDIPRPNLDLNQLCVFDQDKIKKKEIDEFIEYVKKIFPNKSNNLGVLMQSNIDEKKALKILKDVNYDVCKAKFILTFPALAKSFIATDVVVTQNASQLNCFYEKFVNKNSLMYQKQEITHFKEVLDGIDSGVVNISFQELSFLIKDARSNKFKIPLKVKRVFEESILFSRKIEKLIDSCKKIEDLEILMEKVQTVLILPQNFTRLQEFLSSAKELEASITEIIATRPRNFKQMQSKINPLKTLNLKSFSDDPINIFKKLHEKCQSYFNDIQQIINPYTTKSNHKKFDFQKIQQILDFFLEEEIEDPRIVTLSQMIHETHQQLSISEMFLEDTNVKSCEFISSAIEKLQNGKFDFKNFLLKVKNKQENMIMIQSLRQEWFIFDKTKSNLKKITKLLNCEMNQFKNEIKSLQKKIELIEHVK